MLVIFCKNCIKLSMGFIQFFVSHQIFSDLCPTFLYQHSTNSVSPHLFPLSSYYSTILSRFSSNNHCRYPVFHSVIVLSPSRFCDKTNIFTTHSDRNSWNWTKKKETQKPEIINLCWIIPFVCLGRSFCWLKPRDSFQWFFSPFLSLFNVVQ